MTFEAVHPRDFGARFGIAKPSRSTIHRWQQQHGFPLPLTIPRGYYKAAEIEAWLEQREHRVTPKA